MKRLLLLVPLVGCSQILGLDNTSFDQKDARVDAPSSCDGAPRCTSTTGRSVCGQLFTTGTDAGAPMRVASPTGKTCAELGASDGPCALSIQGQAKASFFSGIGTDVIAGEIDDCGRFVIPDVDATAADVAVVASGGTDFIDSAVLVLGRPTMPGTDTKVELPVVTAATKTAWGTQLDGTTPPDVQGGYLITYVNSAGVAISGEEVRIGGGSVGKPPTLPWAAYFSGTTPFGTLDPAQTATQETGTAVIHPATSGAFMLGGFRTGNTCPQVSLQSVATAIIHVVLRC